MFKKFKYHLRPPELEQAFLASRFESDKRKMKRVYWLALYIVSTFLVLGIALLPPSLDAKIITLSRAVGIGVALLGLLTLNKIKNRKRFEWVAFACLFWLIVQFEIVHRFSILRSETLLAWSIFVAFLIYLTVPISLRFRLVCVIFLSVSTLLIWFYKMDGDFHVINCIGVTAVYLATNIFGIICATNAERTEREGFQHLESEARLKANLETTFARLEESVESRNQIYRVLAHDLRSGIGALGSIGQLLAEDEDCTAKEREELIKLICESSKASYELLDNLLQWAISESGSVDPNPQGILLDHSLSNCVGFLKVFAHDKQINLSFQVEEPITVWADPKMLDTVIRNLTSNAIKFTKPEGTVEISAKKSKEGFAVISIKDSGVGIEKERLERIFQLKYGESSSGTAGEKGTNLGLRICSEFVKKLGGEIWVTSEVGTGTQFNFTVPIHHVK